MFRAITAFALASASALASATAPATLTSTAAWWERVTILVTDDGQARSCRFESSLQPNSGQDCTVDGKTAASTKGGAKDQFTRITFERRFTPGAKPDIAKLEPGETLLGGRLMALAIDAKGAVKNCEVVATSGSVAPQYSCAELRGERFEASVGGAGAGAEPREAYMSILVYGHSEHVV